MGENYTIVYKIKSGTNIHPKLIIFALFINIWLQKSKPIISYTYETCACFALDRDQLERQDQVESEDTQGPLVHLESKVYLERQEKKEERWRRINIKCLRIKIHKKV